MALLGTVGLTPTSASPPIYRVTPKLLLLAEGFLLVRHCAEPSPFFFFFFNYFSQPPCESSTIIAQGLITEKTQAPKVRL